MNFMNGRKFIFTVLMSLYLAGKGVNSYARYHSPFNTQHQQHSNKSRNLGYIFYIYLFDHYKNSTLTTPKTPTRRRRLCWSKSESSLINKKIKSHAIFKLIFVSAGGGGAQALFLFL